MAERILVVGALHLDVVVTAPHLPARDETVMGEAVAYRLGGKGGNQAVAAARLGAPVAMAGRVGRDGSGDEILAALDAAGVDRRQVIRAEGATGMSVAVVERGGDYDAVVVSGVNRGIEAEEVDVDVAGAGLCLLQNEVPEAVNLGIAAALPEDTRLILNAAPAREVPRALMERLDLLVVNRVEAAQMTGVAVEALEPGAAALSLAGRGPGRVMVTLGAEGLVCAEAGGLWSMAGFPVAAVSSHGAGDAFLGALAAELGEGRDLRAAARVAQAYAALVVSTEPDARGGLGRRELVRFLTARA